MLYVCFNRNVERIFLLAICFFLHTLHRLMTSEGSGHRQDGMLNFYQIGLRSDGTESLNWFRVIVQ